MPARRQSGGLPSMGIARRLGGPHAALLRAAAATDFYGIAQ